MKKFKISETKELIKKLYSLDNKIPILINGPTGVGKTATVIQIGQELNLKVVDFRLATEIPENIGGIPVKNDDGKTFSKILDKRIFSIINEPTIFFLDEFNRSNLWTMNAVMSLIYERRINDYTINEKSLIIAATNYGTEYVATQRMDKAVIARFAVINVKPNVNDTLNYLSNQYPQEVAFLRAFSDILQNALNESGDFEEIEPVLTSRGIEYMVKILKGYSEDEYLRDLLYTVAPAKIVDTILSKIEISKIRDIIRGKEVEIEDEQIPTVVAILSRCRLENAVELENVLRYVKGVAEKFDLKDSLTVFMTNFSQENKQLIAKNFAVVLGIFPNFQELTR
jgi:MoxR-like ATPase